ncbi:MAG TPA: hypothetical protein VFW19_17840 [Allosphingosinicella sp.]|nr:hypothetical protein [Allosphingosinicella sp.]
MKSFLLASAAGFALAASLPAQAQQGGMSMPMSMPMSHAARPAAHARATPTHNSRARGAAARHRRAVRRVHVTAAPARHRGRHVVSGPAGPHAGHVMAAPARAMPMNMPMPQPGHAMQSTPIPMPQPAPGAGAAPMAMPQSQGGAEPMQMPMQQPGGGRASQPMDQSGMEGMNHANTGTTGMAGMDHSSMAGMAGHAGMGPDMKGARGPYPMTREASGTAWQPDTSTHSGIETMTGDWMLMFHGVLNGVYDWQGGPRGDQKIFPSGMLMGMAQRSFADGNTLQFKAMLSPDPLMGRSGYPLLLAAGETANGRDPLIDRQHPHDFFMELSASYSLKLSDSASLFLYGGLPGEPAFGPPTFMHRQSIMDSPEAPITHHWLDSTHITFGVVTAGVTWRNWKLEASRFNGREPDQNRWDIETGLLNSTAVRLSWNPTPELALQGSWARLIHPEQLEPAANQTRWSASAIFTRRLGGDNWWSTTLAWGRKSSDDGWLDALALESAVKLGAFTIFGRGEYTQNDELTFTAGGHHGPVYDVGKISLGMVRDFRLAPHLAFGVGALAAHNFVPRPLAPLYGGDRNGAMVFLRLKVD